jgi:hypothetical protein
MSISGTVKLAYFLNERRSAKRYPIAADLRWRSRANPRNAAGTGKSVNMSSTGILFTTSAPVSIGSVLQLSIDWPVLLHGTCGLQLLVRGRVVRSDDASAALRIQRYEFRTRGAHSTEPALIQVLDCA